MGARLGNQVAILALRFAMAISRSVAPCYVAGQVLPDCWNSFIAQVPTSTEQGVWAQA